ncbi:hypothetical protein [Saccharothrix sp. HUAS TT1]|uniref:hypothetical protein n=1 Tax=unclassified Saccharothrix TaxID=2593673 RepID=UPI00345BB60E
MRALAAGGAVWNLVSSSGPPATCWVTRPSAACSTAHARRGSVRAARVTATRSTSVKAAGTGTTAPSSRLRTGDPCSRVRASWCRGHRVPRTSTGARSRSVSRARSAAATRWPSRVSR